MELRALPNSDSLRQPLINSNNLYCLLKLVKSFGSKSVCCHFERLNPINSYLLLLA